MRALALALLTLCWFASAPAAAKRPITIDDVLAMERVDSAALSPDRQLLAVAILRGAGPGEAYGRTHYDVDPSRADLWLIDRRSGAVRRLTDGRAGAAGSFCPVWSPDGRHLALLSTAPEGREPRGGNAVRLYVWERASGALRRLSGHAIATATRTGSRISEVDLRMDGEAAPRACRQGEDNAPFLWLDGGRLLAVARPPGAASGLLDEYRRPLAHAAETLATRGAGAMPTVSKLESGPTPSRAAGDDARNVLHLIGLDGRDARVAEIPAYPFWGTLAIRVAADRQSARLSAPTGLAAPAAGQRVADLWADRVERRHGLVALRPGAAIAWGEAAGPPDPAPDPLAPPPLPDYAQTLIAEPGYALWAEARADGLMLTEAETESGRRRVLMTLNSGWAEIDWSARRAFTHQALGGETVRGTVLLPPGWRPGRRAPALVWLYPGYSIDPGQPDFFTDPTMPGIYNLHLYAARGYVVIVPAIPLPQGALLEDLPARIEAGVMSAVDALVADGTVDPDRLGLFGQSFGGYATASLIGRTSRFKAAAALAGIYDLRDFYLQIDPSARGYPGIEHQRSANIPMIESGAMALGAAPWEMPARFSQQSPIEAAGRIATPLLIAHGELDVRGAPAQAEALFTALWRQGKPVRLLRYWGESHGLALSPANVRDLEAELIAWFARWLGPPPPP